MNSSVSRVTWSWEDTPARLTTCTLVNVTTCRCFAQGGGEAAPRGATLGYLRARRAPVRGRPIPARPDFGGVGAQ